MAVGLLGGLFQRSESSNPRRRLCAPAVQGDRRDEPSRATFSVTGFVCVPLSAPPPSWACESGLGFRLRISGVRSTDTLPAWAHQ